MNLTKLLNDPSTTIHTLAEWLDAMDHAGRMEAMGSTSRAEQRKLFDLAAAAPPLTMEHFVPTSVAPRKEVIHHGRNSLPAFRHFQKRFSRPEHGAPVAFGYNEGATRPLIGPGYFVLKETTGNPTWEERGAWVVDYFHTPEGPVPEAWPRVVPNSRGLQVLVYHRTRDFMRRVSHHVSIGTAFKNETPLNSWFTLVREDG